MSKFFHKLSTRIFLEILLAAAVSAIVFVAANLALTNFFIHYAEQPEVFKKLSDRHFESLQQFAQENQLVSTDGKAFTEWNDRYYYVSVMIIRQNEELCYNSFVSYDMTYTDQDSETFYWGSKVLPTYEYKLQLTDEVSKVYFSGYFDQAYTALRKTICSILFVASFALVFFLLFQKYIKYISEMERNVTSICNKNFSEQIAIRSNTELSSLASKINHLSDTIQLLLLMDEAKIKQKEQFVKSIAHDIRTPLTAVIGYLELLSKGYGNGKADTDAFIERALEKTNHIRRLTDNLFSFEESYKELSFETYDGQELLTQISSSIASYLKSNRFCLDYHNCVSQPFQIQANITLLMRLIDNICSNVVKHGDQEKPVTLNAYIGEGCLFLEEKNLVCKKPKKPSVPEQSGYGLIICEEVMNALGGTLLHGEDNEWFLLKVQFPILPPYPETESH